MHRRWFWLPAMLLLITACAAVPAPTVLPVATSTPQACPVPKATWTSRPLSTPTGVLEVATVEGLVMMDGERLIVGVDWLSKSRITYIVQGGDVASVKRYLGETARVTGQVVHKGPWLKELAVRAAEASDSEERLSMRRGYIKELGISIYMQGSHLLVDREGTMICLLDSREGGPDLDQFMRGEAVVIGVLSKTVEGDAQIMDVRLVEPAE